jgi:hypothetical protein
MKHIFGGGALTVAGIAAFIEASAHQPEYGYNGGQGRHRCSPVQRQAARTARRPPDSERL